MKVPSKRQIIVVHSIPNSTVPNVKLIAIVQHHFDRCDASITLVAGLATEMKLIKTAFRSLENPIGWQQTIPKVVFNHIVTDVASHVN